MMLSLHHSEICSWVLCDGVPSNVTAKVELISYFIFCMIISRAYESCEITVIYVTLEKCSISNRIGYCNFSSNFDCDMTSIANFDCELRLRHDSYITSPVIWIVIIDLGVHHNLNINEM